MPRPEYALLASPLLFENREARCTAPVHDGTFVGTGEAYVEKILARWKLTPGEMGLKTVGPEEIFGGQTVKEAAGVFKNILEGNGSRAQQDVVVANAALALYCMDESRGIGDGMERARRSLESGAALGAFKKLMEAAK